MENPRTDAARAHDDSDLIENSAPGASHSDASGGNLQRDVASHDERDRVDDPDASTRVQKSDTIEHGTEVRPDRARAPDNG